MRYFHNIKQIFIATFTRNMHPVHASLFILTLLNSITPHEKTHQERVQIEERAVGVW